MHLRAGTSGFSYKAWKGVFYPEDLPQSRMLAWYAEQLPTVEINNTFYRMPKADLLERWAEQVPESFAFALKASQRITHRKRLKEVADEVAYLYRVAASLGQRRGPVLFQLPPNLRRDDERLAGFLAALPEGHRAALEFRHQSWLDERVFARLREAGAALVCADTGEPPDAPVEATADFGYLRLRRPGYEDAALAGWVERVGAQPWSEAYVFFKHEDEGAAPRMAARFRELFERRGPRKKAPAKRRGRKAG